MDNNILNEVIIERYEHWGVIDNQLGKQEVAQQAQERSEILSYSGVMENIEEYVGNVEGFTGDAAIAVAVIHHKLDSMVDGGIDDDITREELFKQLNNLQEGYILTCAESCYKYRDMGAAVNDSDISADEHVESLVQYENYLDTNGDSPENKYFKQVLTSLGESVGLEDLGFGLLPVSLDSSLVTLFISLVLSLYLSSAFISLPNFLMLALSLGRCLLLSCS